MSRVVYPPGLFPSSMIFTAGQASSGTLFQPRVNWQKLKILQRVPMFDVPFVASLLVPTLWRLLVGSLLGRRLNGTAQVLLFAIPVAFFAIFLGAMAYQFGADGFFILIVLATFWGPQIAVIAFFFWCDTEEAIQRTAENQPK